MDGSSNDLERTIQKKSSYGESNGGYFLLPLWLRPSIQDHNGLDGFLLDYGFNFLPYIGFIIYFVLLFT